MKWCFHIHIDMYKYNELMTISDKQSFREYDQLSNLLVSIFIVLVLINDRMKYSYSVCT